MTDFERFKAAYEQPMEQAPELPTPAKAGNGPRFAAVTAPVQHVAGTVEAFAPKDRAKRPVRSKTRSAAPAEPLALLPEMVARFVTSAIEREAIRKCKEASEPAPWTADPILAGGHFCNVHRENDRVSRWITAHVIEPNRDDPDLVLKVALARFLNEPEALARLHWPAPFNLAQIYQVLQAHWDQGGKLFRTSAYKPPMPPEVKGMGTLACLFEIVLPPIVAAHDELAPRDGDTLEAFCDRWRGCYGIGPFLTGQITADMKHVAPLIHAADWRTFAVPGPGSERGLNRICGRPIKTAWSEAQWHATLLYLRAETEAAFAAAGLDPLDAQNVQNWLCEFDKYERARESDGKPSRKYKPTEMATAPKPAKAKRGKKTAADIAAKALFGEAGQPTMTTAEIATTTAEIASDPDSTPQTESSPGPSAKAPHATVDPPGPAAAADAHAPVGPPCLAAALDYAAHGWKLFPVPRGSRKSHRKAGADGERWGATRVPEAIRQDFARWSDANIGLPTDRDNGFWVLEADTLAGGHAHDGFIALDALVAQHGPLPGTRIAESPSGSRHYYFRWPQGLDIRNRTNWPALGLDVRGDGGMVIAPPSLRDGKAYRWISEAEIAEAPAWLLGLVAAPDKGNTRSRASSNSGSYVPDPEALAPLCDIEAALRAIPIESMDTDYSRWISFGHAIFAASGGSAEGLALFDAWTRPSAHYDAEGLAAKWQSFHPDRIGFDYLASEAHKADPQWRLKAARANTERANAERANTESANTESANAEGAQQTGPGDQRSHNTPPELISVYASEVGMEALRWLWPGRFALGKLGIIAGLPDEGKGLLTMFMAACCTNPDLMWPCGEGKAPQGNVILLTAEDDIADTVAPRLVAAGADRTCIAIVKQMRDTDKYGKPRSRMFNLARDLEMLRAKITEIGNVVLIIIDPVSAYMGPSREIDSFRDTDVRSVLAPLQDLAGEMRAAVIGLMHFNKKVDVLNMLLRICNSIAFAAAARHAYGVVHDPDSKRQLLVRGKNNLARRDDRALAFRIDAREVGKDWRDGLPVEAPFLIWEAGYVDITATEALQAVTENKSTGSRSTAKRFLQQMLRDGPALVSEIEAAARAERIASRTLDRAKAALGVVSVKDGKVWKWQLPQEQKT
jgi:hypothetical protein